MTEQEWAGKADELRRAMARALGVGDLFAKLPCRVADDLVLTRLAAETEAGRVIWQPLAWGGEGFGQFSTSPLTATFAPLLIYTHSMVNAAVPSRVLIGSRDNNRTYTLSMGSTDYATDLVRAIRKADLEVCRVAESDAP